MRSANEFQRALGVHGDDRTVDLSIPILLSPCTTPSGHHVSSVGPGLTLASRGCRLQAAATSLGQSVDRDMPMDEEANAQQATDEGWGIA
jgi:hypothetical protein